MGWGHEQPTALGLYVFGVVEGNGKNNLTRKSRKRWRGWKKIKLKFKY